MSYSLGDKYGDIEVDISDVTDGLDEFNVKAKRAIRQYLEQDACPMLENYMQSTHPWKNRTRTAEIGLSADIEKSGNMKRTDWMIRVILSHSAYHKGYPYGLSLEYGAYNVRTGRMNKAYPILEPTARLKGADVVEGMKAVVERYYF